MILSPSHGRERVHVFLAVGILLLLVAYRLSIELVEPMREFFQPHTTLPVVDIITNFLFLWLVILMVIAFRNWRKAVVREKELERVVSSISPDVFMVVSPSRMITMCNTSVKTMFGYAPDEVINHPTDLLYFDRREKGASGEIFDCLQKFGFHIGYATGRRRNGQTFPLEIITGDLEGHPGAVLLVRDITERKQAEDALRVSHRELVEAHQQLKATQQQVIQQERLRVLGQMSSYVAHEFNNALTPILGFSELLIKRPEIMDDRDMAIEYITDVRTAAEDAAAVVKRLSDFYRQKDRCTTGPVNLNEAIKEAISICRPKWQIEAQATNRRIEIDTDLDALPPVNHNREEVHEILTNLIFNAVDAMPDGGAITIQSKADGQNNVILTVSDTGTGMTQEVQERCFEPFFTQKGPAGTGLGLAVISSIVKRWGGEIRVESGPGKGTKFSITMPTSDEPIKQRTPVYDGEGIAQTLKIMVVDDDPLVSKVVKKYLETDGHLVEQFTTPLDALKSLTDSNFNLVITDWAMPGMSGTQLTKEIKQKSPGLPVIMMTGIDSDLAIQELDNSNNGADLLIKKPLSRTVLRKALLRVMAQNS